MFAKLLKYEFKNINKWFLGLYAGIIGLAIFIGLSADFSGMMDTLTKVGYDTLRYGTLTSETLPASSIQSFGLMVILLTILLTTLFISTLVLIIQRFKHSIFDREGYLTMTLPVNTHQILGSKLLGAIAWFFGAYFMVFLSFFIIVLIGGLRLSGGLTYLLQAFNPQIFLLSPDFWQGILYSFVQLASGFLLIYMVISAGQTFETYKNAMSILFYIVLVILLSMLHIDMTVPVNAYAFNIITGLIYYGVTYYIIENKLNLS